MRQPIFQYQALAEVPVEEVPVEPVQLGWLPAIASPVARPSSTALLLAAAVLVPVSEPAEALDFALSVDEPRKRTRVLEHGSVDPTWVGGQVDPSSWQPAEAQPRRRLRVRGLEFGAQAILVDPAGWLQPLGVPTQRRLAAQGQGVEPVGLPELGPLGWLSAEPTRISPRARARASPWLRLEQGAVFVEPPQLGWLTPLEIPTRRHRLPPAELVEPVGLPTLEPLDWLRIIETPPQRRWVAQVGGVEPPLPPAVELGWLPALEIPQRRHRLPPELVALVVAEPEVANLGWLPAPGQPVRRIFLRRASLEGAPFPPGDVSPLVVVSFTPSVQPAGRPATRNTGRWTIPDLGSLRLRSDRLSGGMTEARLKAPSALASSYDLSLPAALPGATKTLVSSSSGQLAYGLGSLTASAAWTPPGISNGARTSTTVTVTGAALGDRATASFSVALPDGMIIVAEVSAANTVKVTLFNIDAGASQTPGAGTVSVDVWRQ